MRTPISAHLERLGVALAARWSGTSGARWEGVNGPLEGLVGSSEGAFGASVQLMRARSECPFHTQAGTA